MRNVTSPEDQIYICGFSRGAFTARALAGMVNLFGILRPEHEVLIPTLLHVYFSQAEEATDEQLNHTKKPRKQDAVRRLNELINIPSGNLKSDSSQSDDHPKRITRKHIAHQVKTLFSSEDRDIGVHWIGVWDTVESVGLPGVFSQKISNNSKVKTKKIRHVRHAISLDEHRYAFKPRYYDESNFVDSHQSLIQKWFAGCHCDVGGSYIRKESQLSDSALEWIAEELFTELGLIKQAKLLQSSKQNTRAVRHDPLWDTPTWALAGMIIRDVPYHLNLRHQTEVEPQLKLADKMPVNRSAIESVWQKRRPVWPLLLALFVALLTRVFTGSAPLIDYQSPTSPAWAHI